VLPPFTDGFVAPLMYCSVGAIAVNTAACVAEPPSLLLTVMPYA
jgi:hypothetical protein